MEIKTVRSFLDYYEKIRERTSRIIEAVPPEHIDFTYKSGKFTIGDQTNVYLKKVLELRKQ